MPAATRYSPNGGRSPPYLWVRYTDANNGYRFKLYDDPGKCKRIHLHSFVKGEATLLDSQCYTHSLPLAIKVKLSCSSIKMWAGGTLEVDLTDSAHAEGRVAFGGWGNPRRLRDPNRSKNTEKVEKARAGNVNPWHAPGFTHGELRSP